jgi:hypothetical protein
MRDIGVIRELALHYKEEADYNRLISSESLVAAMYDRFSALLTSLIDPPKTDTQIREAITLSLKEAASYENVGQSLAAQRSRDAAKLLEWALGAAFILEGGRRTVDDERAEAARLRSQNEGGP